MLFLAADPHIKHAKIAKARNFDSVEKHDITVMLSMIQDLTRHDVLWILGDVLFCEAEYFIAVMQQALAIKYKNSKTPVGNPALLKPNFSIKIAPGNHDRTNKLDILKANGFISNFSTVLETKHQSNKVVCSHIPIHPYSMDRWDINIHGHLHTDTIPNDPRYKCVSWEQHKRSISIDTLLG